MEQTRIVITGVGVVAPSGIGKEAFWKNCLAGVSGIKPITLFDTSKYRCHHAGEISNFQPEQYLGSKGLRNLDRTTLLALVAAKLAIDDAKLEITDENRNDIGVVLGSTMGSVHSISEFDKEGLREGPRYVNPAKFPNTVINSPASQVAIRFGLRGLNTTISTGFTASLDAVGYAIDMLRLGRAKTLLVGGAEELCIQTFAGFERLGLLANEDGGMTSRGLLLGEGAAFLVMSGYGSDAELPQTDLLNEAAGYGTCFDPHPKTRFAQDERTVVAAVERALHGSGIQAADIDEWSRFGNGAAIFDDIEQKSANRVFNNADRGNLRGPLAQLIGETFSARGVLELTQMLGISAAHRESGLPNQQHDAQFGVVAGFSPLGASSAVVLRSIRAGSASMIPRAQGARLNAAQ